MQSKYYLSIFSETFQDCDNSLRIGTYEFYFHEFLFVNIYYMVKLEKSNDHNAEDYAFSYFNTRVYFSPNMCRNLLISMYNS